MSNDDLRSQSGARRATVVSTGWYGGCNFEVTLNGGEGYCDDSGNGTTHDNDNDISLKNNSFHTSGSDSKPIHERDTVTISFVNLLATASEGGTDMRGDNSNSNRIPGSGGDVSTTVSG
jgi:hypothetical protein